MLDDKQTRLTAETDRTTHRSQGADDVSLLVNGVAITGDPVRTQLYVNLLSPSQLGRYIIEGVLGSGGFGTVYRARDDQLQRDVAIKVPHPHRVRTDAERRLYLSEARTLASLDHPGIVPVYDFGVLEDGRCFVVSKLVPGTSLAQLLAKGPPSWETAVPLLLSVAKTLHYVHACKLIHRDIKPANLLLDQQGNIFVADFGLAMHEADIVDHQQGAGTPQYMSPEQAGCEGHRIDSRTDLFSLGTVMYEVLTGVKPFAGATITQILENVVNTVPVTLLHHQPALPSELNRICLKLLAKRAADRYQTGDDLARDLQHSLAPVPVDFPSSLSDALAITILERKPATVLPRGLRAYDGQHAYFFLQLLPGPFDRDGLPESLSHWVRWVEHPDDKAPELYRLGVIAGPSGCGKSSLVRAGLLPLLDSSISSILIEASLDQTEQRLSTALDQRFPDLVSFTTLTDKLAALRRGRGLADGKKLLIVIDQWEQWLYAVHHQEHPELIRALRQCDGERLQCLVLVRDDFWLALNRFMEAVEAPLVVGKNVALMDLFDPPHARDVLTRFGRAYGRIPTEPAVPTAETQRFIEQSVEYIAQDGKVFPVHLSLFAEMVKGRPWVPATLRQLGGAVGIGVQFLRESLSAAHAPAGHRLHEEAARRILESLLPAVGTAIKTQHRTRAELVQLSGYENDPANFHRLMQLLEGELKLIAPVDAPDAAKSGSDWRANELYYQLSHDFLVLSIREWLYSEQRKTFAGRCRLLLSEQAAAWTKQPVGRNLPLWFDWVQYRSLLQTASLDDRERRLLSAADRYHGIKTVAAVLVLILAAAGFQEYRSWNQSQTFLAQLKTASITTAPSIIDKMQPYRRHIARGLSAALLQPQDDPAEELKLRLADVRWNPASAQPLRQVALNVADVGSVLIVREALLPHAAECCDECWRIISQLGADFNDEQRQTAFRAALMLAAWDPPEEEAAAGRWQPLASSLGEYALGWSLLHPDDHLVLVEGLRPLTALLSPHFQEALGKPEDESRRSATRFLRDLHAGNNRKLTEMVTIAAPWQWPFLKLPHDRVDPQWLRELLRGADSGGDVHEKERRTATAAAILLAYSSDDEVWKLLRRTPQPGVRSQLIDRIARTDVPLPVVERRLVEESDPGIVQGLLLALGNYPRVDERLSEATRERVQTLFASHGDAGVHSAAEWFARRGRISLDRTNVETRGVKERPGVEWRVLPEGLTMVRFDATDDPRIGRVFEIGATEITVEQFHRYHSDKYIDSKYAPTADCPVNVVKWPEALLYCDWLSERHGLTRDQFCCPSGPAGEGFETRDERLMDFGPDEAYLRRSGYRLPTGAEWEFACSAGTRSRWYCGSNPELMSAYAWYLDNSARAAFVGKSTSPRSLPVALFKPNDRGLFDMLGNVMEWCADGPSGEARNRYVKGGTHATQLEFLESTSQRTTNVGTQFSSLGLRIARTIRVGKEP